VINIEVDPATERALRAALRKLSASVERKIVKQSIHRAANPIAKDMKGRLPTKRSSSTGNLRKSIGKRTKKYPSGVVVTVVGPRRRFGRHGHLVEFGTGPRWDLTKRVPKYTGIMPARPFARPAYMAKRRESLHMAISLMWQKIRQEAAKNANR